ncbi:MAG: S1C family serine protease [Planctomycetota bacterium]
MKFVLTIAACSAVLAGGALMGVTRWAVAQDAAVRAADPRDTAHQAVGEPEPKPADPSAERIREWVSDLSDPSYRIREAATRRLRELGSAAVPYLVDAQRSKDLELRRRVSGLLAEIDPGASPPERRDDRLDADPLRGRPGSGMQEWERSGRNEPSDLSSELSRLRDELQRFDQQFMRRFGEGMPGGWGAERFDRWFRGFPRADMGDWLREGLGPEEWSQLKGRYQVWRDGEKIVDREFGEEAASSAQLGVRVESAHPALRAQLSLGEGEGLVVAEVLPNSPAAAAGFEKYDLITQVNGAPVADPNSLRAQIAKGDPLEVEIVRVGKRQVLTVTLPASKPQYR